MFIRGNILVKVYDDDVECGKVIVPEGVTSISTGAFKYCSYVKNITLPNSLKSIGIGAFYKCSSLTNVNIPEGVTSIESYTFYGCRRLVSVTLPESLTSIGIHAFRGCHCLKSITIPNNVTSIGYSAFAWCRGLTNITLGSGVTSIEALAFNGCYKLVEVYNKSSLNITKGSDKNGCIGYYAKAIYTEPYESKLSTDENGYILYTDGEVVSLIGYTGTDTALTLPQGITEINQYAFSGRSDITSITLPDSVTNIGEYAFSWCTNLNTQIKSYKAFNITANGNFRCLNKTYNPEKLNYVKGVIKLCNNGIHYCTNLFEIFDYYSGEIDKDIAIFEIEPGNKILKSETSKCCTNSCKLIKRLYKEDIIKILNGRNS